MLMKTRGGAAQCPAQRWTSGSLTAQKNTSHRDKGGEQGAREQEYKLKREGERERQRHSEMERGLGHSAPESEGRTQGGRGRGCGRAAAVFMTVT